jgi:anti-sigma factor RsiW
MTPDFNFTCAECEEHLTDLLDGTIGVQRRAIVEAHLKTCSECTALAQDAGAAMAFAERAAAVELPATLVPRILAEISKGPSRVLVQASLAERIFGRWIRPMLQPRFALSLAMAALSIAMIPRVWSANALEPGTINPRMIWTMAENRIYRTFDRAVKNYENLALVADVQSQIDELRDIDETNIDGIGNYGVIHEAPDSGGGGQSR